MRALSLCYDQQTDLERALAEARVHPDQSILIQIFSPASKRDQLSTLNQRLLSLLPKASIIGCSTSAALQRGLIREQIITLSIICFDKATINVTSLSLDKTDQIQRLETAEALARKVVTPDTKLVICYAAADQLNAENLAKGISLANPRITLAGGIASSSNEEPAWICSADKTETQGIVIAAISAPRLHVEAFHSNDWMMLGTPMHVTGADANILTCINDTPAQAIYQHYLGTEALQLMSRSCERFPLLTQRNGKVFARSCSQPLENGGIALWGNLEQGSEIRFGILDPVAAMDAFHQYTRTIQKHGTQALLMFPSQARKTLMRSLTEDEGRQLQSLAPTSGCFCSGQFFYQPEQPDYLHYAQTIFSLRDGEIEGGLTFDPDTLEDFSQDTLQLRAMSKLVGSTTREMEENNRVLEELASTDPLTGALNRYKMQILLEQEHRRVQRYARPLSVIMFDLDHFKLINDQHGHHTGDIVLQKTAKVVRECIRDTDAMARWGGEEFLILCPETDLAGTTEIAERLRRNLASANFPEGLKVTASIGVTAFQSEDTLDRLLKRADQALYLSKKKGRDCVTVFD